MRRDGLNSVAMLVRYEHASEERYALLEQAINPVASGDNSFRKRISEVDRARRRAKEGAVKGQSMNLRG